MKKKGLSIILAGVLVASVVLNPFSFNTTKAMADVVVNSNSESTDSVVNQNYVYLSDMEYDKGKSSVGYGSINMDKNIDGGKIKLIQEGEVVEFNKGIGAHARSQVVYDVSKYSTNYNRFVAHLGVDKSMNGNGDGVIFKISISEDGNKWVDKEQTEVMTSNGNSKFVDLDITGAKYLRLIAESNKNITADHSVYADARLVKKDYDLKSEIYKNIKTLKEYDAEIANNNVEVNYSKHKRLLQERELVNRLGYQSLQNILRSNVSIREAFDWLMKDDQALQLFIEVGEIDQPGRFLNVFSELYKANKDLLGKGENNLIYKKMLIALAVGWSSDIYTSPLSFSMPYSSYNAVERFRLMKQLYDENKFARMDEFKGYNMELMRMVMHDSTPNDDLLWLNGYSVDKHQDKPGERLNMWAYGIGYVSPNYNQARLYDEANKEAMTKKYLLDKYNIKYGEKGKQHIWMVMEAGGICWNTSRFGQNLLKSNGVATVGIFQPGHEAVLQYSKQEDGHGKWGINNNVGGWQRARTVWAGSNGYRMLLDWGGKSFISKDSNNSYNGAYTLLAQAALDDKNYEKSYYYNLVANSLTDSQDKINAYNKALDALNINLDSFEGLINEYKKANKPSSEWKALAEKVIKAYTYYPYAMVDLLKLITPNLSTEDAANINIYKTQALTQATQATKDNVYQFNECRDIAKSLIGKNRVDLASFSFNGENANKIVINDSYKSVNVPIEYSLDGGKTWEQTEVNATVIELTNEQLKSINETNDIKLRLLGSTYVYTIDIQKGAAPNDNSLYKNDLENRLIGKTENLEYSTDGGETWQDYTDDTRFQGHVVVKVRYKANGVYLASDLGQNTFNVDTSTDTRKYITIDNITLKAFSSQQDNNSRAAKNMIDGNGNTGWHTAYGASNDGKFYTVEFKSPKYIASVEYVPNAQNGRLRDAEIYTSMDGETWTLSGKAKDLGNNTSTKNINLDTPTEAKFVKIVAKQTWGNSEGERNKFFSGKMFNFFEDTTAGGSKSQLSAEEMSELESIIDRIKATEKSAVSETQAEENKQPVVSEDENKENTSKSQLSAEEMSEFENIINKIESINN